MIEKVREAIVADLAEMNYDTSGLTGDMMLGPEGLDLDSLAVAELAVRLEDAFGVRFGNEEIVDLSTATFDELIAVLAERVERAPAAPGRERS